MQFTYQDWCHIAIKEMLTDSKIISGGVKTSADDGCFLSSVVSEKSSAFSRAGM